MITTGLTPQTIRPAFAGSQNAAFRGTASASIQNGPAKDVFFGGFMGTGPKSPADSLIEYDAAATDKVELKNGSYHSLGAVMTIFNVLKQMAKTPPLCYHLLNLAREEEDAELPEMAFMMALNMGLVDGKGQMPEIVKDIMKTAMEVTVLSEDEAKVDLEDPLVITIEQRDRMGQRVVDGNSDVVDVARELLQKGDQGLDILTGLSMMGLTGDVLAEAYIDYCDGDMETFLERYNANDSVLLSLGMNRD